MDLLKEDISRIKEIMGLEEGPNGLREQEKDTSWTSLDNETITLEDIIELTKDIEIINLPTRELSNIVLNWDDNPDEIDRISQVEVSEQYPILIMVDEENNIQWILDGNHRTQKALKNKLETIPAKLIKPSDLSVKAKKVLLGMGNGEIEEQEGDGAPAGPAMDKWETGLTRGKANPIDTLSKWETGITRGKGNPVW